MGPGGVPFCKKRGGQVYHGKHSRIARPRVASAASDDPVMTPSASRNAPSSVANCYNSSGLTLPTWKVSVFCPHDIQVCQELADLTASTSRCYMPSMPDVTRSLLGEIWTKFQDWFSLSLFLRFFYPVASLMQDSFTLKNIAFFTFAIAAKSEMYSFNASVESGNITAPFCVVRKKIKCQYNTVFIKKV